MLSTTRSSRGMVTAPHALAAQTGAQILAEGGNAIEAALATAATLAVVYPHMTGLGGDGFWLIAEPGRAPLTIAGAGRAGARVSVSFYRERGLSEAPSQPIPSRAPCRLGPQPGQSAGNGAADCLWQVFLQRQWHSPNRGPSSPAVTPMRLSGSSPRFC